jgi:UDP-3-O-[3-hydroxymyristoyl] N-acetylglucosamine deacetylase
VAIPASISGAIVEGGYLSALSAGHHTIKGAELLLAALESCGVDNARIEIEGGMEIPIVDGSALGWTIEIQKAGLREAPAAQTPQARHAPAPQEVIGHLAS